MRNLRASAWALLAVFSSACGGGTAGAPATKDEAALSPEPAPAEPGETGSVAIPATPAGEQLSWVLAVLNERKGAVEVSEIEKRCHQTFLDQVSAPQLVTVFEGLAAQIAPLRVVEIKEKDEHNLVARAESEQGPFRILLSLEPESGQMAGLLFRPAGAEAAAPKSWKEVEEATLALGDAATLLIAELDGGTCEPVRRVGKEAQLAIGSTFKLYVLLALADRIAAGEARWDERLSIREEQKSLPSGVMQNQEAGESFSIRHFAEKMISISDNTATDHLLYKVGRKRVEAAVAASGHQEPAKNVPFLGTRELFLFKLSLSEEEVEDYLAMDAAARRRYLDEELPEKMPELEDAGSWKKPRNIDTLEWFASPSDLCSVMAALKARGEAEGGAPVLEVLAKNPGVEIDGETWPYVGYKGGSEPGVLNMTWLARRADGAWFVVTLGINDREDDIPLTEAVALASGVFELLGAGRD